MDQFFQLVQHKYNNLGANKGQTAEKVASQASISETDTVTAKASNQQFYYKTNAGIVPGGSANQYVGNTYQATSIVKTANNGIYTLLSNNGSAMAWVKAGQLSLAGNDSVAIQTPVQNIAYLNDNAPLYYLMNNGFKASDISGPYSYSIRTIAKTTSGRIFYLLNDNKNGKPFMWVENTHASLKNSLDAQQISTIKGRPAVPDKKGEQIPASVTVNESSPTSWLLESGLTKNGNFTREGSVVYCLGTKAIKGELYANLSVNGFDTIGYVPSSTIHFIGGIYTKEMSKQAGVVVVNNPKGAPLYAYPDGNNVNVNSPKVLPRKSAWKYKTIVTTVDGNKWYSVGNYQWVKGTDVAIKY